MITQTHTIASQPHTLSSHTSQRSNQNLSKSVFVPTLTKKENEKAQATIKYKKHRANKGFREFSALNNLLAHWTNKYSERPTIFYTEPLGVSNKSSDVSLKGVYLKK